MLFTADLKSFSSYGLSSPSSSAILADAGGLRREAMIQQAPTPPLTPSPSPVKRKRSRQSTTQGIEVTSADEAKDNQLDDTSPSGGSLADRVKKRRRVSVAVTKKA